MDAQLQQLDTEFNPNDYSAPIAEADADLLVRFFTKSVQSSEKSKEAGRPVFVEKEYVDIKTPGNRSDAVCRPARHADKQRFSKHYVAFRQRLTMPEEGTPLTEWGAIPRTQAEEMAFFNIKTVEQLACVSAAHSQQFMGFNALQEKARKFIEDAKKGVDVQVLQDELKTRDSQIAKLQDQMQELLTLKQTEEKAQTGEAGAGDTSGAVAVSEPKPALRRRKRAETTEEA